MIAQWIELQRALDNGMRALASVTEEDVAIAQTPKELVYEEDRVKAYRYEPRVENPLAIPTLLVYAMVGRVTVVDVHPGRSFVHKLLDLGLDLFMIDWGHPVRGDRWLTIDDYVCGYLDHAVQAVLERSGSQSLNLLSICQGGVFNLAYAALFPDRVKNLVLMVTPVDFHADVANRDVWRGSINKWIRGMNPEDVELAAEAVGNIPGPLTGMMFSQMTPIGTLNKYSTDLMKVLKDREALLTFLRMERWLYDQPDLPGGVGRQWLRELYQDNRLARNEWSLDGRRIVLSDLQLPILNIVAEHDHIVPPECTRALRGLVGTSDYTELVFPGGHVGVFVGSKSQKILAPAIADWLMARK
jgi:polyhydroxyalkanoate synthase